MRTFKYTYLDVKGNQKESTVEADDKDDAYIILKTMRVNPLKITETEAEDISFEVVGEAEKKAASRRPKINYGVAPRPTGAPKGKGIDGIEITSPVIQENLGYTEVPKSKRKKEYRPPYEMFALFCLGVILLGWSAWATARDSAHLDWPIAKGEVIRSEFLSIGVFGKTYKPDIAYTYKVDGLPHRSEQVFAKPVETDRGDVLRLMKMYPDGKKIRVYYNPDNHDQAYLEAPGEKVTHTMSAIVGLLCFGAASGLFIIGKINAPAKPKPSDKAQVKKEDEIEITTWSAHTK